MRTAALIILSCLLAPPVPAASRTIRPGTLDEAVRGAAPGDTLYLAAGRYRVHDLVIGKPMVLAGDGDAVLDGEHRGYLLIVKSPGVTLRGLRFENSGRSDLEEYAAVKIENTSGCRVEDNRFDNNYFGIYLAGASGCVVRGNAIMGHAVRESASGNGIHLWKCRYIAITGNAVRHHRDGIYIEFGTNSFVAGNRCTDNLRYGLHFMFSDSSSYTFNHFAHNGTGVAVMYTRRVTMSRNTFDDNKGGNAYGLLLKDISHSAITGNLFRANTSGLYMEGSNDVTVQGNRFTGNGSAMRLLGNCFNDVIRGNDFSDNTFDVTTNAQTNLNALAGNYWDHYTGYDLDKDGVGDVPYCPVSLYSKVTEEYPASLILLNSFFTNVLNGLESLVPTLVPAEFSDPRPAMKPVVP